MSRAGRHQPLRIQFSTPTLREPRGLDIRRDSGLPDATLGGNREGGGCGRGTLLRPFKLEHVPSAFIADGLARLQVRYPEIPVVFADSWKVAEEWTYRFLAAALSDAKSGDSVAE